MSDDQQRSNQGRFLNNEEDETPVPGPAVPSHFPNPSTGSRNALGGPTPFSGGQFPNPPTGQFGATPASGQFPVPTGQFPASPTGQFGAAPPAHFPNPSTGNRNVLGGPTPFGTPASGQFPVSPTGQFPVSPTGQFPVSPTGQFPVSPTGQFPNTPTGQFPNTPTGQFPNTPTGQFGPAPFPNPGSEQMPIGVVHRGAPDVRMRLIYGGGGAGIGLLVGLLLGILNSGLEQMTFTEGLSVTIQIAVWFMLLFGIACAFKPQRVEFILKKHGLMDS